MQKVFFIAVILGAVVFSSCDDDGKDSVNLYDITKDYFSFSNGSTWKYELEGNSSIVESVVSERFSNGFSDHGSKELEFFIYDMISSSQDKIVMRAEAGALDPIDRIVFINFLKNNEVIFSPILWNSGIDFSMEVGDDIEYLNSFEVNSETFKDVYHIQPKDTNVFRELYVARNVGVIKKTYANDSTYILVDYNIIQ